MMYISHSQCVSFGETGAVRSCWWEYKLVRLKNLSEMWVVIQMSSILFITENNWKPPGYLKKLIK